MAQNSAGKTIRAHTFLNCGNCTLSVEGKPCESVASAILEDVKDLGIDRYDVSASVAASIALASMQPGVKSRALEIGAPACAQILSTL